MVIVAFLALVMLAAAVALLASAGFRSGSRRTEHLEQIVMYGYLGLGVDERPKRAARNTLDDLAGAVGAFASGRLGSFREDRIQKRLLSAGFFGIGPRRFNGYRVMLTLGVPVILIWLLTAFGTSAGMVALIAFAAALGGWIGPSILLSRRARTRLRKIDYGLPELIDLLVVTLEAGVAFGAALRLAGDRLVGPLGEEIRLTIHEQSLGLSMLDALENWLGRCDTPSVRSFVRSMVQGNRLGVSIGQILRNLAVEMRARRRALIEEKAQKTPVKIMFPLVFLIFPALFVIVLGPALFKISGGFGN
jgi:tight adherence protein C